MVSAKRRIQLRAARQAKRFQSSNSPPISVSSRMSNDSEDSPACESDGSESDESESDTKTVSDLDEDSGEDFDISHLHAESDFASQVEDSDAMAADSNVDKSPGQVEVDVLRWKKGAGSYLRGTYGTGSRSATYKAKKMSRGCRMQLKRHTILVRYGLVKKI